MLSPGLKPKHLCICLEPYRIEPPGPWSHNTYSMYCTTKMIIMNAATNMDGSQGVLDHMKISLTILLPLACLKIQFYKDWVSLCSIIRVKKLALVWWRYFWQLRPSKFSRPWISRKLQDPFIDLIQKRTWSVKEVFFHAEDSIKLGSW